MFAEFRARYPRGSIQTEMLPKIDGMHTCRAVVSHEGITLATAIGVDSDPETAEDRAVKRALTIAGLGDSYRLSATLDGDYTQLPALSPAPKEQKTEFQLDPPLKPEHSSSPPLDLSDCIAQISAEMERVGWDKEDGRRYTLTKFNKRSRQELTPQELLQFLNHLKSLPSKLRPSDQSEF